MKVSENQVVDLIRIAQLRADDKRLTPYTRQQAQETVSALTELLKLRHGVPVEGVVS
jgi:hypothetical protein